jgi:hypothetical protein
MNSLTSQYHENSPCFLPRMSHHLKCSLPVVGERAPCLLPRMSHRLKCSLPVARMKKGRDNSTEESQGLMEKLRGLMENQEKRYTISLESWIMNLHTVCKIISVGSLAMHLLIDDLSAQVHLLKRSHMTMTT